jgi:hypothetical protein
VIIIQPSSRPLNGAGSDRFNFALSTAFVLTSKGFTLEFQPKEAQPLIRSSVERINK